ncbi:MAG: VWA domain-containing protein [Planctomycetota bacterium]|nr:VWA domain-containing protein [Planctomycetota bacterium]
MLLPSEYLAITLATLGLLVPSGESDVLGDFRKAFRATRNPEQKHEQRLAALNSVKDFDDPKLGMILVTAYSQVNEELAKRESEHREYVLRLARNKALSMREGINDPRLLLEVAMKRITALRSPASIQPIVEEALSNRNLPLTLRLECARLARFLASDVPTPVLKLLSKRPRSPGDTLILLTCAGALGPAGRPALKTALDTLSHQDAALRVAAFAALSTIGSGEGIAPLIERMELEQGHTLKHLTASLQILTGQTISSSKKAWKSWLKQEGQAYREGRVPLGQGKAVVQDRAPGGASYHGLPLEGQSVLFVVDVSQSMHVMMARKDKAEEAAPESRLERALAELARTLQILPPATQFNIVAFAGRLELYAEESVLADPEQVQEAITWLNARKMNLGTRIHDALEIAFHLSGRRVEDAYFNSSVDTIFLLTDGQPIAGSKTDPPAGILRAAKRWNLDGQVIIHTVGLGDGVPVQFLKKLAKAHGGQFAHEKSKPK